MRFAFTDEQRGFQKTLRDFLAKECPPSAVRAAWAGRAARSDAGRDAGGEHHSVDEAGRWSRLAALGVVGLLVPEELGGLALDEIDLVLLLEECGRAALPDPVLETSAVAVPLLREAGGDLAASWLPSVADGTATIAVGLESSPFVTDAARARLILLERGGAWYALDREQAQLQPERSVDGARRLFRVGLPPGATRPFLDGAEARHAADRALDRGALGAAAELIGLSQRMIDLTVEYVKVREQFGRPIGSFQAVKHHLADATLKLEFARPVVYRAAHSVARDVPARALHVSMAKACASDAATLIAKKALQCHGAIGYSFEHDLHLFMKRAWALAASWGDAAFHRARVASLVLDRAGHPQAHPNREAPPDSDGNAALHKEHFATQHPITALQQPPQGDL